MKTHFAFGLPQFRHLLLGVVPLLGMAIFLGAAPMSSQREGAVARPEAAPHPIRSIIGKWQGSFQSDIDRSFRGVVVLEITEQQHARFGGGITADVLESTFRCKGTISPENEVQFVTGRGGDKLSVEGKLTSNSMRLQYRAVLSDGLNDYGTVTLAGRPGGEIVNGR